MNSDVYAAALAISPQIARDPHEQRTHADRNSSSEDAERNRVQREREARHAHDQRNAVREHQHIQNDQGSTLHAVILPRRTALGAVIAARKGGGLLITSPLDRDTAQLALHARARVVESVARWKNDDRLRHLRSSSASSDGPWTPAPVLLGAVLARCEVGARAGCSCSSTRRVHTPCVALAQRELSTYRRVQDVLVIRRRACGTGYPSQCERRLLCSRRVVSESDRMRAIRTRVTVSEGPHS